MDAQTPQTVAQAVQAATAAQQAAQQQSPPVQLQSATPSSSVDNLTCQWQGCGERTDTPESLYDHVCDRHVGRKSTNNLNLTCQWGACRTTTVKRDHITSHIRVHVPLKPHKCDFCGKSFKRPQDLKKHVKTHADDSVLANSPGQSANGRGAMGGNGGMTSNGKSQSSFYPSHDNGMNGGPYGGYQHNLGSSNGNGVAYGQPAVNGQYGGYGSVSYPKSAAVQDLQSIDTRRRAIEALNDFLGDIKRRALNPTDYYDVGQRLGAGGALPLPVGGGYNTGYSGPTGGNAGGSGGSFGNLNAATLLESFNHGDSGSGGGLQGTLAHTGYALPMSNARTKHDLQDIDRFLEQLQQTVYETSNHSAAAGIQHPGIHAQYNGDFGFGNQFQSRSSGSPPNYQQTTGASTFGAMTAATIPGLTASTSAMDTPALTPASVSSYSSSGQSPMSSHGRGSLGNSSAMYPSLPAVTGMSDLGSGYPVTTSAPASGLASGFEGLDGRRYSGGRLQRQAPGQDTEMADADDGAKTPKAGDAKRDKSKGNSSIDPALRGEDSSDNASTPAARSEDADKRQEDWVENIRTIESLRKWISERLSHGDFEGGEEGSEATSGASEDGARAQTEIAKMVHARIASETEVKPKVEGSEVSYPTLPSA
ncbi:hypothetical protein B0A55_09842 [Friedmanniomyces simplex]|uniref:C2H2-type domain-containing protein n=1 Tax=Friedmanniomyces simplex TaxID=329884 RepID=A0A4V5NFE7_9PEZI|nr:hypothetical protein B0A55_09842 [Friedmanniomyces simplex]